MSEDAVLIGKLIAGHLSDVDWMMLEANRRLARLDPSFARGLGIDVEEYSPTADETDDYRPPPTPRSP